MKHNMQRTRNMKFFKWDNWESHWSIRAKFRTDGGITAKGFAPSEDGGSIFFLARAPVTNLTTCYYLSLRVKMKKSETSDWLLSRGHMSSSKAWLLASPDAQNESASHGQNHAVASARQKHISDLI